MILDEGICTVFHPENTAEAGKMPTVAYTPIWASWYGRMSYETAPAWATEGRKELKADGRIRIQQCSRITQNDVVVLEHLESFDARSEGAAVYRVIRAFHGNDDDSPEKISDLTLEVVKP